MAEGNGQPRGLQVLASRFGLTPDVIADAFSSWERLNDRMEKIARGLEDLHRTELRGELFSRVETAQAPGGGGLAEVMLTPAAGAIWEVDLIAVRVENAAADRNVALYLGGATGDRGRPIGVMVATAAVEGIVGGNATQELPSFPTNRGVYARFLALAAGETAILHVLGRELVAS